jgi:hypothetical protein
MTSIQQNLKWFMLQTTTNIFASEYNKCSIQRKITEVGGLLPKNLGSQNSYGCGGRCSTFLAIYATMNYSALYVIQLLYVEYIYLYLFHPVSLGLLQVFWWITKTNNNIITAVWDVMSLVSSTSREEFSHASATSREVAFATATVVEAGTAAAISTVHAHIHHPCSDPTYPRICIPLHGCPLCMLWPNLP